jgi:hypothetical protein
VGKVKCRVWLVLVPCVHGSELCGSVKGRLSDFSVLKIVVPSSLFIFPIHLYQLFRCPAWECFQNRTCRQCAVVWL